MLKALATTSGFEINWPPETNEVDEVLVGETDFQNLRGLVFNNPCNWKRKYKSLALLIFARRTSVASRKRIMLWALLGFFKRLKRFTLRDSWLWRLFALQTMTVGATQLLRQHAHTPNRRNQRRHPVSLRNIQTGKIKSKQVHTVRGQLEWFTSFQFRERTNGDLILPSAPQWSATD